MHRVTDEIWTVQRSLRFWGLETGARMTVVRMKDNALFVHSPIALDEETKREVDALGRVAAIVAPSRFHHLYVGDWTRAYPNAIVCCCPGLESKRRDVAWSFTLGDEKRMWSDEIDHVHFGARSLENEVVFFHRKTKTIVCADMIFNLANHPSRTTRVVTRMLGQKEPGATWLERILIRDRKSARSQIDRMLEWGADRIVLAHGDLILQDGNEVVRRAYAWV